MSELVELHRRWYQAHLRRFETDAVGSASSVADPDALRASARELIRGLERNRDLKAFLSGYSALVLRFDIEDDGGKKFIDQLAKRADNVGDAALQLADCLSVPTDDSEAFAKAEALSVLAESVKVGAHPSPRTAPRLASKFWSIEDASRWPEFDSSSGEFVGFVTGRSFGSDGGERYRVFVESCRMLDPSYPARVGQVARWWAETKPLLLDPVLCDRCRFGLDLTGVDADDASENAKALVAAGRHFGSALESIVAVHLGVVVKAKVPSVYWKPGRERADLWIDWRTQIDGLNDVAPGMRLWFNHNGFSLGLFPGYLPGGWLSEALEYVKGVDTGRLELISAKIEEGRDVGHLGGIWQDFTYGRWFGSEELANVDLGDEAEKIADALRPIVRELGSIAESKFKLRPSLVEGSEEPSEVVDSDPIGDLAEELLVDRAFLDDIVSLLGDKGQVIFYGPPGTGKTYLARKLAEVLAPETDDRAFVQFHPSTSYEDFFEGYRPVTDADGIMRYDLTHGPLARMAKAASDSPESRKVMVIDEINRANLPKVLGELLFLFEYRDQVVSTLYRPDAGFRLPEQLWFIGTMNTADRSIALVDAALRRRFHFIPFFPNHGPMEGLLDRWLDAKGEPAWVGELVAMVNDELSAALGGPHLQLGPSYFMKKGLDVDPLRRIWEYNIEPFIEDQFFGDDSQIERFRFAEVLKRYNESMTVDEPATGDGIAGSDAGPTG